MDITEIEKNYHIVKKLKDAGDTCVFLCTDKKTGEKVVIKEISGDETVYKKMQEVNHVNYPKILAINKNYFIEEYIDGIDIENWVKDNKLTEKEIVSIVIQLVNALQVIHKIGIIHRDIKPDNILINKEGILKLLDYSVARNYKAGAENDTRALGTAGFAAPEQYGVAQSDIRTDIYSVGVLLNYLLTGEHPSVEIYKGKCTPIIEKCIQVNMDDRYKNDRELLKAFRTIDKGSKIKPVLFGVAAGVFVIAIIGVVIWNAQARKKVSDLSSAANNIDISETVSEEDDSTLGLAEVGTEIENTTAAETTTTELEKHEYIYFKYDWEYVYLNLCKKVQENYPEYEFSYDYDYKGKNNIETLVAAQYTSDFEKRVTKEQAEKLDDLLVDSLYETVKINIEIYGPFKEMIGIVMEEYGDQVCYRVIAY